MAFLSIITSVLTNSPILSIITLFTLLIGILIIKLFYTGDSRLHRLRDVIPGPPQLPLLGNVHQLLITQEEILPTFSKWFKQYGPRMIYRLGTYWVVTIACAKDMEKLLTSTMTTKSVDYDLLIPWLGEGLLVSNGKKWFHRRKMLTSAFHFKILDQFIDVFNEQSKLLVEILKTEFPNGETFDVSEFITRCTLEIICETAMGLKINAQIDRDTEYINATSRIKKLQQIRALRPWLEPSIIWNLFSYGREEQRLIKILHNFTDKVIRERKANLSIKTVTQPQETSTEDDNDIIGKGKKRLAFLDMMLEAQQNGEDLSDEGIREECSTFMFGGHDTTASAASFTIFLIGNHPEVQAKLHEELNEIFGTDRNRPVTPADLSRLKYLECCIKESMRLCATVPFIARTITEEFELDKGIILPPRTLPMIFLYQLHRDPEVFPEPEEYRPERFFPENSIGRHPFAYLPFSAGARNCIGQRFAMMEEKILISTIFRHLRIESTEKLEDLVLLSDMILHSKSGIKIKIFSR